MSYSQRISIERDYMKNAVVGDVFYRSDRTTGEYQLVTVVRVTKTQLIMCDGARVRRATGLKVGATVWSRVSYLPGCPHNVKGVP